jgi:hypothetical protein
MATRSAAPSRAIQSRVSAVSCERLATMTGGTAGGRARIARRDSGRCPASVSTCSA